MARDRMRLHKSGVHGRVPDVPDLDHQARAVLESPIVLPDLVRSHALRVAQQREAARGFLRDIEQAGPAQETPFSRYLQERVEANLDFQKALLHETCADLLRQLATQTGLFTRLGSLGLLEKLADSALEQEAARTILTEVIHPTAWEVVTTAHVDAAGPGLEYENEMPQFSDDEQARIDAESLELIARVRAVLAGTPGR